MYKNALKTLLSPMKPRNELLTDEEYQQLLNEAMENSDGE